ncbi:ornithine cyclodeaminase family protein [Methylobacterium nodulans]|uniref:Ornithine cyclodeaminase/mu-crystallin n=1 Tax=Methylobacterium nodulans (strain LMG 21967 / CNCM I-2342 / ORS 2060) TaxID=460265 RepID=B8I9V4_METNO|nr:ornithine cyclodeaminase family protein [Methylobacterium nodulans]ACL57182.1 ornithine cyclodeaminase/mu-crystallin [Methylobacterium nodulans ORS 2060]
MKVLSAAEVDAALTPARMVAALAAAFRVETTTPPRHLHTLPDPAGDATLLLMPAWDAEHLVVKVLTLHPGNAARGLATFQGGVLLSERATGLPLALVDAPRLTLWRTAGASALAARYLARPDTSRLLMVGAGALAPFMIRAHAAERPLREIAIWNRRPDPARALAASLAAEGLPARAVENLEAAARAADLICCATLSEVPLVRGAWLAPGTHLDLVGAFTPQMREADDAALQRASVYVDTPDALAKGGDVAVAVASGALAAEAVRGDLAGLCRGTVAGRSRPEEITVFKSVGAALEDLAAAVAVWRHAEGRAA